MNPIAAIDWNDVFGGQNPFVAILDVGLVTIFLYRLLLLVRGTRAWRILIGIGGYVALMWLTGRYQLYTIHYILDSAKILGPVALVILFLPELRQTIESFGRLDRLVPIGSSLQRFGLADLDKTDAQTVDELIGALSQLMVERTGALIVIETGPSLDAISSNGVQVDAKISSSLLCTIFYEQNPLHDGAVIVRGDRIVAAACRLPLSDSNAISAQYHMRHRAAIGVTETIDCVAIVVSEERGALSVCREGRLIPIENHQAMREFLNEHMRSLKPPRTPRRRVKEAVK